MAVQVADTMKAKNNLDFPVVESADIKGGFHTVSSVEERDALLTSSKKQAGMLVYVTGTKDVPGKTYQLADDMESFVEFMGDLSDDQMKKVLEYVRTHTEMTKYGVDEGGVEYLEFL